MTPVLIALDLLLVAAFLGVSAAGIRRALLRSRGAVVPAARIPRWLAFVLVNAGAACLLLDGVILVAAITDPPRNPFQTTESFRSGKYLFVADPELGFAHRPNFSTTLRLAAETVVHHDAIGARVENEGDQTPAKVDLVTLGCSQSWGQGVSGTATSTFVLARMKGWKVANLSIQAHGGVAALLVLRRRISLAPSVVCYVFWFDHENRNVKRNPAFGAPVGIEAPVVRFRDDGSPYVLLPGPDYEENVDLTRRWFLETSPGDPDARSLWTDVAWTVRKRVFDFRTGWEARQAPYHSTEEGKRRASEYVLSGIQKECAGIGARLFVVYLPDYLHPAKPIPDAPAWVAEAARREGFALVDMAPRLREMRAAGIELRVRPDDGHIAAAVHRAIAEEVARRLSRSSPH